MDVLSLDKNYSSSHATSYRLYLNMNLDIRCISSRKTLHKRYDHLNSDMILDRRYRTSNKIPDRPNRSSHTTLD